MDPDNTIDDDQPGRFEIRLQGKTAAKSIDIEAESGHDRANIKEFTDVVVDRNLLVELVTDDENAAPTVAAIEVLRQD